MKNNRREFLKMTGMAGAGMVMGRFGVQGGDQAPPVDPGPQRFNMHGYAAPALDVVRVGVVGLGNRGSGTVLRMASIEGVEITALCDLEESRVRRSADAISDRHRPRRFHGSQEGWKRMCEMEELDLVCIATPWHLHTDQAVFAMEHGKHVFVELPAAQTLEECWRLVNTSEETRRHCVQEASSCHSPRQAVMLNMARRGFLGELVHGEGAYIHDLLLDYNFTKTVYHSNWRLKENIDRHGNLYPQHGLGTIAQMMDLNYGDRLDYMVSMSTNDFSMGPAAERLAAEDPFWEPYVGRDYRGNMNTSILRTRRGRTIMLQHDVSSPRPYTRIALVSGTEGIIRKFPRPIRIARSHDGWLEQEEVDALFEEYTPEMIRRFSDHDRRATTDRAGHSYARVSPTDWKLIDSLRNGLPVEMDVYDAALWSSIIPLSEWSAANGSHPADVPDFTRGAWQNNPRGMDIDLNNGGGTTRLL